MFTDWSGWISTPMMWPFLAFHIWMLVDAVRREEWVWAVFIFLFPAASGFFLRFLLFLFLQVLVQVLRHLE
ncbi:MAG: hypothetical protein EB141_21360, partial [Verrucomicrobia bacterium]|nr:hypothetical protein [Verrucomicrobiota bacterium]